jgi:hypothetical protein
MPTKAVSVSSPTTVSAHTAASSSSLLTTCPARLTNSQSTASALGGRFTASALRKRGPRGPARRYGPKLTPCSICIFPPPAAWSLSPPHPPRNFGEISELFQDFPGRSDVSLPHLAEPTRERTEGDPVTPSSILDAPLTPRWRSYKG